MYINFVEKLGKKETVAILSLIFILSANATEEWPWEYYGWKKKTATECDEGKAGWGYGYDSLMSDILIWRQSPFARVDSVGVSARKRILWMVTITQPTKDLSKKNASPTKERIFVHARTHPSEVQSTWVVNKMIEYLLSASDTATDVRTNFIFHFVPMYNPDGVEMGCSRENADGIDLESHFNQTPPQPEVRALKAQYAKWMKDDSPIRVALNLHSSVNLCKRFFFFHHENGTSQQFATLQIRYIMGVQKYFPNGIENWDYMESWKEGTRLVYPESYFWTNFGDRVMALTYEDMNCITASSFDKTARALVLGSVFYIRENPVPIQSDFGKNSFAHHSKLNISRLYDALGRTGKKGPISKFLAP